MNDDQEYRLVYDAIRAVAARCDGARSEDFQGFNGIDTHYGRRVASVPFEEWTEDVKVESARVILTYKEQVLRYTDIDVSQLEVVRAARGLKTLHSARDQARRYERQAKTLESRKVVMAGKDLVKICWAKGDPDFGALLEGVRALPGRKFDRDGWLVPISKAAAEYVQLWDIPCEDQAADLLEAAQTAPVAEVFHVVQNGVATKAKVIFPDGVDNATFHQLLDAVRQLPGRSYNGTDKSNSVDLCPALLRFAARFNLKVHPDVAKALEGAQEASEALHTHAEVLRFVSRQAKPENLPEAFVALVRKSVVR